MPPISRRMFLHRGTIATTACLVIDGRTIAAPAAKRWRAAIIGCTGQGDYGHGLDQVFQGVDAVEVTAVADPHETGRARAAERSGAKRQYADYQEMLDRERPELVVIAPRWSERHFEFALASIRRGAHVLSEKPFTTTLAQADELLAAAKRARLKIAVAHQMRLAPSVVHLQQRLADGFLGELVHLRSWGKQDARAGGEDLMVLGTHIFDMMRLLAGDARSCAAQVRAAGHEITRTDARRATEQIGLVAGDEVEAQFAFAGSVTGSFTSRARLRDNLGPWAIEVLGTTGAVRIFMDIDPIVLHRRRVFDKAKAELDEHWRPLPNDPSVRLSAQERGFGPANRRVVADWLEAIERDREPQCSGENAAKAIEFVMAIYQAALQHKAVELPLVEREHPLA